jgi:hypothetical protein
LCSLKLCLAPIEVLRDDLLVKFTRYGIQSYNLGQLLIIDQTRIEVYNAYEKTRNIHAIWKKNSSGLVYLAKLTVATWP